MQTCPEGLTGHDVAAKAERADMPFACFCWRCCMSARLRAAMLSGLGGICLTTSFTGAWPAKVHHVLLGSALRSMSSRQGALL